MFRSKDFHVCIWTRFYRRNYLIRNQLFFPEGFIHEDEAFALEADLMAKCSSRIQDKLYCRRVRAGSTMTGLSATRHLAGYIAAWQDISIFLKEHEAEFQPDVRRAI